MKLNNHVQIRSFLLGLTSPASHSSATHTHKHTHSLTHCLKLDKIQEKKCFRETTRMALRTRRIPPHIYKKLENRFRLIARDCLSNFTLCLAATLIGNPDTHCPLDRLISSPACSEVLVLVMWLTQGGETNVWPQHDQKVLWSLSKPLTIPAMPGRKPSQTASTSSHLFSALQNILPTAQRRDDHTKDS